MKIRNEKSKIRIAECPRRGHDFLSFGFCILILALCGSAHGAESAIRNPQSAMPSLYALLNEANSTFQQANAVAEPGRAQQLYTQAALLYERIIDQGQVRNAKLFYNLGNAYFLTDDLGRAILNYRRAVRLDGSDVNIRNNLAFARSRRIDRVAVQTEKRVLQTLFFWHYDFSVGTRFFLACLCFAGLCLAGTLMIWLGRGPASSTVAVLTGVLWLCLLVSVVVGTQQQSATIGGVVTAAEIVARQGDGPNYPPSFKDPLHAGTEFSLLEQRPGWLHIELSDGSDAWIPESAAELV